MPSTPFRSRFLYFHENNSVSTFWYGLQTNKNGFFFTHRIYKEQIFSIVKIEQKDYMESINCYLFPRASFLFFYKKSFNYHSCPTSVCHKYHHSCNCKKCKHHLSFFFWVHIQCLRLLSSGRTLVLYTRHLTLQDKFIATDSFPAKKEGIWTELICLHATYYT